MIKNTIAQDQNAEHIFKYLKARSSVYRKANRLAGLQILLTAFVPAAMAVAGIWLANQKGIFALFGLSIALLDMLVIDRKLAKMSAVAAKLGEEFDCRLFAIDWSDTLVGTRLPPETVREYCQGFPARREIELKNWYPEVVSKIPHQMGVVLCQRTNLWYDSELRLRYAEMVKWSGILAFCICFGLAWVMNYSLQQTVLAVLAPMFPFFAWTIRTFWRQADVSAAQARNLASAETMWKQVVRGTLTEENLRSAIRDLQSAIFARRSSSPLIVPFLYRLVRPRMEDRMAAAAEHLVEESGIR
jgi:hypothetical protein